MYAIYTIINVEKISAEHSALAPPRTLRAMILDPRLSWDRWVIDGWKSGSLGIYNPMEHPPWQPGKLYNVSQKKKHNQKKTPNIKHKNAKGNKQQTKKTRRRKKQKKTIFNV